MRAIVIKKKKKNDTKSRSSISHNRYIIMYDDQNRIENCTPSHHRSTKITLVKDWSGD